jgi:L-rhamnose mutarotase
MEKRAWKAILKPGMKAEYVKRHDELWPEMAELLKAAGICNYTIWNIGDELFGYYECEKGVSYAEKAQAESPVVARWNAHMSGLMDMVRDEAGAVARLEKVFTLD